MDPNNKKDQKNNQNRNRNMRGGVTLIIWALVLTVVFALFHRQVFRIRLKPLPIFLGSGLISILLLSGPAAMRSRTASSSTSFRRIRWRS